MKLKTLFKKKIIPICFLCSVFSLGLFFGIRSWNKSLYVQWSPSYERGLAQEESSKTILHLSYENLNQKASEMLFSQNQVIEKEDSIAFYLGNFLVKDPHLKEYRFICQIFPLVEFSFSALGISLSGEEGLMVVQSPCNMENTDLIGPFWIPKKDILKEASKKYFEIPEKNVFVHFYNASTTLTPSWFLKNVRFFNENQDDDFLIHFTAGQPSSFFELVLKDNEKSKPIEIEN